MSVKEYEEKGIINIFITFFSLHFSTDADRHKIIQVALLQESL